MKALVLEEYNKFAYKDVPDPALRDEKDLLVRVRAAAIQPRAAGRMSVSVYRSAPTRPRALQLRPRSALEKT